MSEVVELIMIKYFSEGYMMTKTKTSNEINSLFEYNFASKAGLHLLAPYVGKIRPALGRYLIQTYNSPNGIIWDPFCGSGTIPLEGWINNNSVIGSDMNIYAYVITMAKLHPPLSFDDAKNELQRINNEVIQEELVRVENIPEWVRSFFHPETLIDICQWISYLKRNQKWFYLACLLGILHHQRPGFLSYPSSHGAPYLRDKKYPITDYPEMYEYKSVYDRMLKKINRSLKNMPVLDYSIKRNLYMQDSTLENKEINKVNTIITSPPYMKALSYARDNRLRLWFLGVDDWSTLDKKISPSKSNFSSLMKDSISRWSKHQEKGGICILIVGDLLYNKKQAETISDHVINIASQNNYKLIEQFTDPIPEIKKIVKGNEGIKNEIIIVLQRG